MFKDNTYNLEVENKLSSNKEEKKNTSSKTIYVDVKGAVKNPGVLILNTPDSTIPTTPIFEPHLFTIDHHLLVICLSSPWSAGCSIP